jgi:hypothetical protein
MRVLILFSLFYSGSLFSAASIDQCILTAENHGHHYDATKVETSCYELIRQSASGFQKFESLEVSIFAYSNLLLIDYKKNDLDKEILITGDQTLLKNIKAVAYSKVLDRVFVLDTDKKSVFSFQANRGGNIAPKRTLLLDKAMSLDQLRIDDANQELYVLSTQENWIKVFKYKADIHNQLPIHDITAQRSFTVNNGQNFVVDIRKLYLLDGNGQLSRIDKSQDQNSFEAISLSMQSEILNIKADSSKLGITIISELNTLELFHE